MPRFEMIDREALSGVSELIECLVEMSDILLELESQGVDIRQATESLAEMGVLSKDIFDQVMSDVHHLASQGEGVMRYIQDTTF